MADEDNSDWLRHWQELEAELQSPSGETAVPSQDAAKEKNRSGEDEGESGKNNPNGPSADFAALINAIKKEGVAYRKEEQREDGGKKFREWVTIVLIAMTFGAVCWQVHEMVKVYEPIKNQADAAKAQAVAMTKQAEISARADVEAQRAWVGPQNAAFNIEPTVGKPIEITLQYQNTGRSPAFFFQSFADPFPATAKEQTDGTLDKTLSDYLNACKNTKEWQGGSVVYSIPSGLGGGGYVLNLKTKDNFVTQEMVKGDTAIIIRGCFVYRSFDLPRHSYFCFFYKQGQTKAQNLNICASGHYAD